MPLTGQNTASMRALTSVWWIRSKTWNTTQAHHDGGVSSCVRVCSRSAVIVTSRTVYLLYMSKQFQKKSAITVLRYYVQWWLLCNQTHRNSHR